MFGKMTDDNSRKLIEEIINRCAWQLAVEIAV